MHYHRYYCNVFTKEKILANASKFRAMRTYPNLFPLWAMMRCADTYRKGEGSCPHILNVGSSECNTFK
jgi:hypothetical protein